MNATIATRLLAVALLVTACGGKDAKPAAGDSTPPTPVPVTTAALDGATEYNVCATCHQADGKGMPNLYPPLAGSTLLNGPVEKPIAIVLHGLVGPVTVNGAEFNGAMMPWGQALSDDQIAAILTYERSSWGNTASAVTAAEVAAVRKATASRTTQWTIKELESATLK